MSRDYVLQTFRPPVELNIDYAGELNAQQHAAVTASPGPSLVIAGAGSGKTRTLTYRVAFLLEQGIPPESILLLTFTNKAAREMMRRVADLLGHELPELWGGTFHSIGNRVLRRHADRLGFERNFAILDREDSRDLLQACLGDAAESRKIDLKATRFPKGDVLGDIFSLAVNMQKPVAEILASHHHHFLDLAGPITDLQRAYTERKRATNAMDFDDLLVLWLRLLREHADVLEFWQRRCQFILVDEYQDTNQLQGGVIDLLGARHHNVMVVGDDAQSIYAWRGANFRNILEFPKRYPNTAVYRIETNYRSTPEILALANSAIAPNVNQFAKELAPARKSGMKPALVACEDSDQQAAFVAERVLELREEGTPLDHMAVLYRSHFHALELQLHLTRRNIPFSITSGIRFFEQAHVKDVAAYLKFVCNPRDEISFKRLVQLLPGIGGKGAAKLWNTFMQTLPGEVAAGVSPAVEPGVPPGGKAPADSQGLEKSNAGPGGKMPPSTAGGTPAATTDQSDDPDWNVTPSLTPRSVGVPPASSPRVSRGNGPGGEAPPPLATALQRCAASVPKKAATAWAQLTATISQLETPPVMGVPGKMIELVLEAGYEDHLKETFANHEARLDDLTQLAVFARQFPNLDEFLSQLALLTNVEAEAEEAASRNDDERLRLSTIHQAKGLEFDAVFVIMLCDGLFPSSRSIDHEEALEEERRLFYVAITRAKNELYLSHPLVRLLAGAGTMMMQPSRFLHEIQRNLVEEWNLQSNRPWA